MFIGSMDSLEQGYLEAPKLIREVLEYLRSQDYTQLQDGKYPIAKDGCYALLQRYQTSASAELLPETHQKYIDIQYVISGEEYLGWCPMSPDLKVLKPYDEEKDITVYEKLIPEGAILLSSGCYAVLYPDDVHCPRCNVGEEAMQVTKVVAKIPVDFLDLNS